MFDSSRPNADTEKNDFQDLKKKRDEYAVEIRKQKRDDILQKKRNRNLEIDQKLDGQIGRGQETGIEGELRDLINKWIKQSFDMDQFMDLVAAANSNDRYKQHYGVIGLRKILSTEQNPPIQPVIDANMVPKFIQFMQNADEPHLQMEAAWALTNIASGSTQQTQSIIDKGGIPCFIQLLKSNNMNIAEQAIWALGNISGDSSNFRDVILKRGGLLPLMQIVSNTTDPTVIKNGTWAISNLCRGKPLPDIKLVEPAIPILCAVLKKETDQDVLTDAAWALSYSIRSSANITTVVETNVIPYVIGFLETIHMPLLIPCLRILGNIISGNAEQTNAVLREQDFLRKLFKLTQAKKNAVRREAFWTISNIAAGNAEQIALLLEDPDYYRCLINAAESDIEDVKREAGWALSNATKNAGAELIVRQIQFGVLDSFLRLLESEDSKTVEVILEGINNILNWGAHAAKQNNSTDNEFLVLLEAKEGVTRIEALQSHPNNDVYLKALKILEAHFELENVL